MLSLTYKHIQEASNTSVLEPHWGYVSRILPCTNDVGSCEYLDAVYCMHDISMLYTFILWAFIGLTLIVVLAVRVSKAVCSSWSANKGGHDGQISRRRPSPHYRAWRAAQTISTKWLLPKGLTRFFGNVTRLQLLVLAILLGYLLIFS